MEVTASEASTAATVGFRTATSAPVRVRCRILRILPWTGRNLAEPSLGQTDGFLRKDEAIRTAPANPPGMMSIRMISIRP